MSHKNRNDDFALVPRAPGALEKTGPGAKRLLSVVVADTLALAKKRALRSQRPLRVLAVNNEVCVSEIVKIIVSDFLQNVTVQSFQDPGEAWQELLRADPDLLITDDLMPKLTGEKIVRRLAERRVAYPIIVTTAYWHEADPWVSDCVKRGVDVTLLTLPFSLEQLRSLLLKHLGRSDNPKRLNTKGAS